MADRSEEFNRFGRYQTLQYVLISLPVIIVAMMNINYVFVAEDINYRCKIPECESSGSSSDKPPWWPRDLDHKCLRPILYSKPGTVCTESSFSGEYVKCDEWIYENDNSIVSKFNLACEPWKVRMVGTAHNAGMIFSMLLFGSLADRFGRKPLLIVCSTGGFIGLLKTVIDNYYIYVMIEFVESLVSTGIFTVGVVLMVEVGGVSKSIETGIMFGGSLYTGEIIFAILAMTLKHWRLLQYVMYTPTILFLSYALIIRESFRWQVLRGKIDEAKETLKYVASMNRLNITSEEIQNMTGDDLRKQFNIELKEHKESYRDVISSKETMKRLVVASFCFFTAGFVCYGLAVNSVYLPGDKYVNFMLTSVTSFPGDLAVFILFKNFGRRVSLQFGFTCTAVFLVAQKFTPDDSMLWLKVLLFLCGKFSIALCFTGVYTYCLELFPTSVRGLLVGCSNTMARIGGTLSPLTPLLATIDPTLPLVCFASTSLVAALLLTLTPETRGRPMLDTIAQVDRESKPQLAST